MPLTPAPGKSAGFAGSVELHQADRPNPLGDLGPALYEPILRQGTGNPRRGAGCMDGELRTKLPLLNQDVYDKIEKEQKGLWKTM